MSVIFKTLEKLGRTSGEGDASISKEKRRRNIFSFKNTIFSIRGILGIGLLVIAVGFAALFGINYVRSTGRQAVLSEKGPETPENVSVYRRDDSSIKKETNPLEIPTPPSHIPVKKPAPGKLYLPSSPKSETPPEQNNYARYLPPKSKMDSNQLSFTKEHGGGASIVTAQRRGGRAIYLRPAKPRRLINEPGGEHQKAGLIKARQGKISEHPVRPEVPPVSPGISMPQPEKPAVTGQKKPDKKDLKKIDVARMEKSARICRLVAKFQEAMLTEDNARVETIIGELASLKGERSDYILKLKAFWRMKQGDYDSASSLLDSLLRKDETDLEAGINMAVIEIKTHRLDQAKKRLERLRDIYQENTLILNLLQKIGE